MGIESSSLVASIALVTDDILTTEYIMGFKKTYSQTLLPMLSETIKLLELDMDIIGAIAATGGPGSFTGLRIDVIMAKGLGLAPRKPLVHVPIADAMAYSMWGAEGLICSIMDAKRSQVYAGLCHIRDGPEVVLKQQPVDMRELAGLLNGRGEQVIFLGDGVSIYEDVIRGIFTMPYAFTPAQMNQQKAVSVVALGISTILDAESCHDVQVVTVAEFTPDCLRKPQAERQREAEQSTHGVAAEPPGNY